MRRLNGRGEEDGSVELELGGGVDGGGGGCEGDLKRACRDSAKRSSCSLALSGIGERRDVRQEPHAELVV